MAQQIQFVYLSQNEYDSLNSKVGSRLYFTSDTNRIYRGSELYASRYVTDMKDLNQVEIGKLNVSNLMIDGKEGVTKEYVDQTIESAIGQVLSKQF